MKKYKKGFSLIELLAVVIILAILALITIPIVGNLIKQARINAAVVSAYGYVEATNGEIVARTTKGEFITETQYEIENYNILSDELVVKYEGKGPDKGWFVINRSKVKEGEFCINGYEIKYENGKATYEPSGEYCAPPPRPTICRITDGLLDYTETTEFEVSKIEDLVCLSDLVKNGYSFQNKTVTLTTNLDFNDNKSYNDPNGILDNHTVAVKTEMTTGSGFTPIGNDSHPFEGIFVGNSNPGDSKTGMYSISNLYINSTNNNIGLFGCVGSNGRISGINLVSSSVKGKRVVGSLVGYLNGGTIKGINIDNVTVLATDQKVGGLVGSSYGTISEVAVRATVSATSGYAGGIIGYLGSGQPNNLLSSSTVSGTNNVGGITSYMLNGTRISGAVVGGSISGSSSVGKAAGSGSGYNYVYVSNTVTKSGSGGYDGLSYNASKEYIGMLDEVIDTIIGGDKSGSGFYFDYESDTSNNIILKKTNDHSFDIHLSGSGTELDPYLLSTEQDFKEATFLINQSKYFKLNNDVDVSTFNHFYGLGTTDNYFNSNFDGNDKTISNIDINGGKYAGIFGYTNGAKITNLNINNLNIVSRYTYSVDNEGTGILVGYSNNTTIKGIFVTNSYSEGYIQVGGLVGYLNGGSIKAVSVDTTSVKANNQKAGGLVGISKGTISEVAVRATVNSTGSNAGGIVGYLSSGKPEKVLSDSNVTGTTYVGGLAGWMTNGTKISGVVTGGTITGTSSVGKAAGSGTSESEYYVYVSNTVTKSDKSGYDGFIYNSLYHYMAALDELIDTYIGGDDGSGYYFDFETNTSKKIVLKKVTDHSFDIHLSGSGTELDPYLLSTEQDFKEASLLINQDKYFKISTDVDVSTFNHFYGLGTIGTYFNGKLDGNNKTISNVNLNGGKYTGIVGYTNGATITNLNISNSNIIGKFAVSIDYQARGVLVGYSNNTTIKGLFLNNNYSEGHLQVGGLVGYLNGGSITAVSIESSSVKANNQKAGGLVGISKGSIVEVAVRATVNSTGTHAGGIVGELSSGKPEKVLSDSTVTGTNYVGGLAGWMTNGTKISGVVTGGNITGTSSVGKAAGAGSGDSDYYVYVSNTVTKSDKTGYDGFIYNPSKQYIGMLDEVIDTYIGKDNNGNGYYFDFETNNSNKIVLKKVTNNSFDINLSGSGTSSDPYLLSTERDFKEAAALIKENKYFKINNDVDLSTFTHFYQLGTNTNKFNGTLDGDNKTISNLNINGGKNGGLISYADGATIKNIKLDSPTIVNIFNLTHDYQGIGSLVGYSNSSNIENINVFSPTVRGYRRTGGLIGSLKNGLVKGVNLFNGTIVGEYEHTGGLVGYASGRVMEVTVRANVTGQSSNTAGVLGYMDSGKSYALYSKTNVTGKTFVGSIASWMTNGTYSSGVVDGGGVTGTALTGKANGTGYNGLIYVSDNVNISGSGGQNGTSYSASNSGNLSYFGSIKHTLDGTQYPLLDSAATGDTNNSGYWFTNDADGEIVVVKIGSSCTTCSEPEPETIPGPVSIDRISTSTGTCPDGVTDTTPPTCTFERFEPVSNGIRAYFSCTDDTSVPTIASMFNATTKESYTYSMITDRGGTVKTGSVNGYTRTVRSTWTTDYSGPKPQAGLCYYYQFAARDQCGNEANYVTTNCSTGFSN